MKSNNHSRGNIVIPVLFIVIAFAVMLTSGKMFNITSTDPNEKFSNPTTDTNQQKQNLQLKKLNFQLKPTEATDSCNHDAYKKADPNSCTCIALLFRCENNKCAEVDPSKSNSAYKGYSCQEVDNGNWCDLFGKEGDGWYCVGKPVIYLYPQTPTYVDVSVNTAGNVVISDPAIETLGSSNGWQNVLAHPNGILFYNGGVYRELFYESETKDLKKPTAGIVVSSKNLKKDLLDFIIKLGLTKKDEQDEFLDWWIPKLESYNSSYWFVSVLDEGEKRRIDEVNISPKPDTFIEFIVYFKPLEKFEKFEELKLPPTPQRIGFTAVEWGGVIGN